MVEIRERPWPSVNGKSIEYEFLPNGEWPPRVTVLASPGKPGGYISWHDGSYRKPEDAEALAVCLLEAIRTIHERHPHDR